MQISELARLSLVPVATVKFYLRNGLLPAGRPTGATRAQYDDRHVQRLRLIRSLVEVAGLSLSAVRRVLAAADTPTDSPEAATEAALEALPPDVRSDIETTAALALVQELGWSVNPSCVAIRQLAAALASLEAVGVEPGTPALVDYGHTVAGLAEREVAGIPNASQEAAVRYVVVGTLFYEPVLLALRRLAHQNASVRRFDDSGPPAQASAAGGVTADPR